MQVNLAALRRIEEGIELFHLQESLPPLEVGTDIFPFTRELDLTLRISHTERSFLVEGHLQTALQVTCCRCLKTYVHPLDIVFDDIWVLAGFLEQEQADAVFVLTKDEVDITERVIEHLIVQLPMRFLCSEECRGLCPQCGADLNVNDCSCQEETIDPRLAQLKKWNKT